MTQTDEGVIWGGGGSPWPLWEIPKLYEGEKPSRSCSIFFLVSEHTQVTHGLPMLR